MNKYNIKRFEDKYNECYKQVLKEISVDHKKSTHWMWFMFPQLKGLGSSYNSIYYGLENNEEAYAFYNSPAIKDKFIYLIKEVIKASKDVDIKTLFGFVDYYKFLSCVTLFYEVTKEEIFKEAINLYKSKDIVIAYRNNDELLKKEERK